MTAGRFFNILEDDDVEWCGYCMGIMAVFVEAVYAFVVGVLMIKN
jgi:hypothetical protein